MGRAWALRCFFVGALVGRPGFLAGFARTRARRGPRRADSFFFFCFEVYSPLSPGGHGAGLGPRGLFCGALRARVGGWPCPRWLSPGSAPRRRAGKLGELAFVRERGDRVGQAACMGLVGCVPVNPGLCIEPECRSPEGLPRRDRAPADQGRRVCVDPGHGVALIGFFPNYGGLFRGGCRIGLT